MCVTHNTNTDHHFQDELGRWLMGDFYKSINTVVCFCHQQAPFDGVIGFSQGAFLGTLLMVLQRQGMVLQSLPRLRFSIMFAGIHTSNATYGALMDAAAPYSWPCLQCCSQRDPWIPV